MSQQNRHCSSSFSDFLVFNFRVLIQADLFTSVPALVPAIILSVGESAGAYSVDDELLGHFLHNKCPEQLPSCSATHLSSSSLTPAIIFLYSLWEGGTRGTGFVYASWLPKSGFTWNGKQLWLFSDSVCCSSMPIILPSSNLTQG